MELVFQETHLDYLEKIFAETAAQEQTADLIVPDSLADCDRVVDSFGTLLVRSEDCSDGVATVMGTVAAGVLFVSEDGQVHRHETSIPFQIRREIPATNGVCTMRCRCLLRSVDARPLNSRKLLVRVGVTCTMEVYVRKEHVCHDIPAPSDNLQLKRTQLPLQVPIAMADKRFPVDEELELPSGKTPIKQLLKTCCRLQIAEQKLVGSKGVFKGTAILHLLYEDTDGALCTQEWQTPFSQYVEMGRELDDHELHTVLALTSIEAEADAQLESRRVFFGIEIDAHCTAVGRLNATVIEDAFCTDGELTPIRDEWSVCGLLDRQTFRETATVRGERESGSVLDAWLYADAPSSRRVGEATELAIPLSCNVLYADGDGQLQGRTLRTMLAVQTAVAENGQCAMTEFDTGELFTNGGFDGTELRFPVTITLETTANHLLCGVCGAAIEQNTHSGEKKPAVILRRSEADEELWDIAKSLRASVRTIAEANGLSEPIVPADTMLLIPLGD